MYLIATLRRGVLTGWLAATALEPARAQTATLSDANSGSAARAVPTAPAIYFAAEKMPSFPGGSPAMLRFLSSRLNYPAAALEWGQSGKVHVRFTVDPESHLHDPQGVRGLRYGLAEEALRLVRLMPWWSPGEVHGQPVWVSIPMPVVFRML